MYIDHTETFLIQLQKKSYDDGEKQMKLLDKNETNKNKE